MDIIGRKIFIYVESALDREFLASWPERKGGRIIYESFSVLFVRVSLRDENSCILPSLPEELGDALEFAFEAMDRTDLLPVPEFEFFSDKGFIMSRMEIEEKEFGCVWTGKLTIRTNQHRKPRTRHVYLRASPTPTSIVSPFLVVVTSRTLMNIQTIRSGKSKKKETVIKSPPCPIGWDIDLDMPLSTVPFSPPPFSDGFSGGSSIPQYWMPYFPGTTTSPTSGFVHDGGIPHFPLVQLGDSSVTNGMPSTYPDGSALPHHEISTSEEEDAMGNSMGHEAEQQSHRQFDHGRMTTEDVRVKESPQDALPPTPMSRFPPESGSVMFQPPSQSLLPPGTVPLSPFSIGNRPCIAMMLSANDQNPAPWCERDVELHHFLRTSFLSLLPNYHIFLTQETYQFVAKHIPPEAYGMARDSFVCLRAQLAGFAQILRELVDGKLSFVLHINYTPHSSHTQIIRDILRKYTDLYHVSFGTSLLMGRRFCDHFGGQNFQLNPHPPVTARRPIVPPEVHPSRVLAITAVGSRKHELLEFLKDEKNASWLDYLEVFLMTEGTHETVVDFLEREKQKTVIGCSRGSWGGLYQILIEVIEGRCESLIYLRGEVSSNADVQLLSRIVDSLGIPCATNLESCFLLAPTEGMMS
eukprot:TRINITY_DN46495_c0_g1_i4.p1 TRINITY_DN46495_c0_g1~~TRINITY_DN46495_c0_g1_i4.p1  ORF type:complete len:660 (+),score=135.92 TRINITY_DN46495_c0_g1_i4:68-1981(+)